MAEKWQMVRVKEKTWVALNAVKAMLEREMDKGNQSGVERSDRFGVSLDEVIRVLIERDDSHRQRGRKKAIRNALKALGDDLPDVIAE